MRSHSLGTALLLAGSACALHAQTPSGGNPLDQLPAPVPLPAPVITPRVDLPAPSGPAGRSLAQVIRPSRFDIEGTDAMPFDEVAKRFAPLVGREVTVGALVGLAAEVSADYKARGLPLSFAFIPDQTFAGGVVRVVAVEGYIAKVRTEGDAGPATERLRAIAERLTTERPLRLPTFERITQLLARLPGVTVAAEASMPARTDGATELVLKTERQPYNISLGADLRQPRSRAVLNGVLNDPLIPGGQLSASTLVGDPSRERLLTLGYTQLVGTDGLSLKAQATRYQGYPDKAFARGEPVERRNTNERLDLSASYPLLLDARRSLTLNGGFYGVDNTDDYRVPANGGSLIDETRVRAFFAQLAYADAQPLRARSASLMVAQGVDGLGAIAQRRSNIPGLSGPGNSRLDFTRFVVDASQRDRFANQWGTALSVGAQYSAQLLPASERISFGGPRFGRGYAAGDGAGDKGWGVGVELNRAFRVDGSWLRQWEPYVLLEDARVSTHIGRPMPEKLRSIALGIRLSDEKHYSLDLAVAKPTGDAAATNPERKVRLSVQLSYQLAAR
jgi:hemolysin activation/secretion protein